MYLREPRYHCKVIEKGAQYPSPSLVSSAELHSFWSLDQWHLKIDAGCPGPGNKSWFAKQEEVTCTSSTGDRWKNIRESDTHRRASLRHKHQSSEAKEEQTEGSHPAKICWVPEQAAPSSRLLYSLHPSQAADPCQPDSKPADSDYWLSQQRENK